MESEAIEFVRLAHAVVGQEFLVGFSGGKDSIVLADIMRRSGVPHRLSYSLTRIDPPPIVRFIRKHYPQCEIAAAKRTFWHEITTRNPPLIYARWCCTTLKKLSSRYPHQHRVMGIRKEESRVRAKYPRVNYFEKLNQVYYYPLLEWSEAEVWDYIDRHGLAYPSLYDENFARVGCVVCPYHSKREHEIYRQKWPGYFKAFEKAVHRWYAKRKASGRDMAASSAEEFLKLWYEGKASWYGRANTASND